MLSSSTATNQLPVTIRAPAPIEAFLSDPVLLVLDDSATMRQVYAYALSDRFIVRAVEKISNARAVLMESPEVIVVDGGLEEADPYETAASLKKLLKKTVAVIATSRFHPWDAKRAAKSGIEHFIDKPFESDVLRARLDVLLGREPVDPPSAAVATMKPNPRSRTPSPVAAAIAPRFVAPVHAPKPVAAPGQPTPAIAAAPAKLAPVVKAPPPKPVVYDLGFSGGWGEEEPAEESPEAAVEDDGFGGGWGDDAAAEEPAEAAVEDDGFGGGWGDDAPAEEVAEAEDAPADAEYTDASEGDEPAPEAEAEAEAEEAEAEAEAEPEATEGEAAEAGWGGEFDASEFAAELTAEDGDNADAAPADEGADDAGPADEVPEDAAPEADEPGAESDAEYTYSGDDTPEAEAEELAAEAELEAPAPEADAVEEAAEDAEAAWGGEFESSEFASELTADAELPPADEVVEDAAIEAEEPTAEADAEYTDHTGFGDAPADADADAPEAELAAEAEPGEPAPDAESVAEEAAEDEEGGWGGEFEPSEFASELTADAELAPADEGVEDAAPEAEEPAADADAEYTDHTGSGDAPADADAPEAELAAEAETGEPAPEAESVEEEAAEDAEAGWGGEFDAGPFSSELTDDPLPTEAAIPHASGSGSELRVLAEELDKLGLTALQASSVLKLTMQIVERAVWDVVPRLAEQLIREELDRLTRP